VARRHRHRHRARGGPFPDLLAAGALPDLPGRGRSAYPFAAILLSTRTVSSEGGLLATEVMLDVLRRGGLSPAEATQVARHALSTVVNLVGGELGVVVREESGEMTDARRRARLFLESLPSERYPRLVEAAAPLSEGVDPEDYFAFGLDLLLAGIEAMAARKR
jgi:TetR/AcrR family transcriptional regulator, tetracycline repressor protein